MTSFTTRLARWGTRPAADIEDAAERLLTEARAATKLRDYQRDADVAALTIERTRERVERVLVGAMTCGLLFTTVNVQDFIAAGALAWSVAWIAAWLVEPFVTMGVLALLRIEQVARRNEVIPGSWVRWTRWTAFGVTYVFNTWKAWGSLDDAEIFKHSAIPVLVFFFAEALTDGRDALTQAANKVAAIADIQPDTTPHEAAPVPPPPALEPPAEEDAPEDIVPDIKVPKGYLKEVVIPAAYRELALAKLAAGGSLDEVSLADVDRRAGTTKYVTRQMIAPLREQFEKEVQDGVAV